MSGIGSRANDDFVQSQYVASLDDQSRDWELVLRESHHRMKNTLTPVSYTHLTLPTKRIV